MDSQEHFRYVFMVSSSPIETRTGSSGELCNLVNELNLRGIDSAILVVREVNKFALNTSKALKFKFIMRLVNFKHLNTILVHAIRKRYLHYSQRDELQIKQLFLNKVNKILSIKTEYLIAWDWESAHFLDEIEGFKKIQILHYKFQENRLKDYLNESYIPIFKETYYQRVSKIAISSDQVEELSGYNICRWLQGINTKQFKTSKKSHKGGNLKILFPLRKPLEKGAIYMIEAAKIIHQNNPALRFTSYGNYDGPVPEFIDHRGFVSLDSLIDLYAESDIFILPSLAEGFSLPVLEAMSSGLATISTVNGGSEQYIENGVNGLLVPHSDPFSIANSVQRLLSSPDLFRTIVMGGIKTAEDYSYPKACDRFLRTIKCLEDSKLKSLKR